MAEHKYLIVHGGGRMELRNGDAELPNGSSFIVQEALTVLRFTYVHGEPLQIDVVKSRMGEVKLGNGLKEE